MLVLVHAAHAGALLLAMNAPHRTAGYRGLLLLPRAAGIDEAWLTQPIYYGVLYGPWTATYVLVRFIESQAAPVCSTATHDAARRPRSTVWANLCFPFEAFVAEHRRSSPSTVACTKQDPLGQGMHRIAREPSEMSNVILKRKPSSARPLSRPIWKGRRPLVGQSSPSARCPCGFALHTDEHALCTRKQPGQRVCTG
jgi:hypothetical protein